MVPYGIKWSNVISSLFGAKLVPMLSLAPGQQGTFMTITSYLQVNALTKPKIHFDFKPFGHPGSLGIRVSPKGKKSWLISYRFNGKKKKFSFGTYPDISLKDARLKAATLLKDIDSGIDPNEAKREYQEAESFSNLWEYYLRSPTYSNKVQVSRREEQRKYDTLLKKPLGHMKLIDIRKKHLSMVFSPLAEKSPVSANRLFSLLSVLFKLALNKDLIELHPMYGMDKPAKEKPRHRYLSTDEIEVLWPKFDSCRPNVRDIFKLILLTCQRPGEVMGMEWTEIDLDKKLWTLPAERTKSKRQGHLIPLSPQVIAILEPRKGNKSEFVFPSNHGAKCGYTCNLNKARYKLIKDIQMEQWGAHDLRRTGRTVMSEIGIAPNVAERVLNHSMGKIEGTYDIFGYLPQKVDALNKLGKRIDRILGKSDKAEIIQLHNTA